MVIDVILIEERKIANVLVDRNHPSSRYGKAMRSVYVVRSVDSISQLDGGVRVFVHQLTTEIDLVPIFRHFAHECIELFPKVRNKLRVVLEYKIRTNLVVQAMFENAVM